MTSVPLSLSLMVTYCITNKNKIISWKKLGGLLSFKVAPSFGKMTGPFKDKLNYNIQKHSLKGLLF